MASNINNKSLPDFGVLRFVLTAFFGAQVKDVENEYGDMEKCVCIPLDRNGLRETDKGTVSAYAYVNRSSVQSSVGWTHYLRPKVNKEWAKKMRDLGYEMPYIGSMKPSVPTFVHSGYVHPADMAKKVKVEDVE